MREGVLDEPERGSVVPVRREDICEGSACVESYPLNLRLRLICTECGEHVLGRHDFVIERLYGGLKWWRFKALMRRHGIQP